MDDLDRILTHIKKEEPPEGLAEQVRLNFHRRHRRQQVMRNLASLAMLAAGCWLLLPWIGVLTSQLSLPQDGIGWLQSFLSLPSTGMAVDTTIRNASYLQQSVSNSLDVPNWLGLLSMAGGTLLGLGSLLQKKMM